MSDFKSVSMMDLAGIDTTQFAEVRGTDLVKGNYQFEVIDIVPEDGESADGLKQFRAPVKLKILGCQPAMVGADVAALVGKTFTHRITKNIEKEEDIQTFIGMVKAFLIDIGAKGNGNWNAVLSGAAGFRFEANVRLKPNSNDKDADPFPILVTKKMKPLAAA